MKGDKVYGVADRAWQVVVGCSPAMSCAPRCWARKTVARVAACQESVAPGRAEFFRQALSEDQGEWSGKVFLDEAHLGDPLRWKQPAVVATGFHGDWGRLGSEDMLVMFQQIGKCPRHTFMLLTKQPAEVLEFLGPRRWRNLGGPTWPDYWVAVIPGEHCEEDSIALPNVTIGCSVMNQTEADRCLAPMKALAEMGWRTHIWYEPAIGAVDWGPWGFIERLIVGGESGPGARPFRTAWAREAIAWGKGAAVPVFMKQVGSNPMRSGTFSEYQLVVKGKGDDMMEWPADLRVREGV